MNLETQIKPELWAAIANSYQSGNYTHAIRDAMSVITEILRDKSGLDGDGRSLVGKALGFSKGKPPRIKVNKFQTETERSIQVGLQEVLKGMYALVRNPRSHERLDDTKKNADAIILFIDYLAEFLGESQQSFTTQGFLQRVDDPYFVLDTEYVEELVEKIPVRKRADTLITLYREKNWATADSFQMVIRSILDKLTESEVDDFLGVVSEELEKTKEETTVCLVIRVLPANLWPRIQKMPRLRIENMLVESLADAWYTPSVDETNSPTSTWISNIAKHFFYKEKLRATLLEKLTDEDFDYHNFVARYMIYTLPEVFEEERQMKRCVKAISDCIRSGNEFMKDRVYAFLNGSAPSEWEKEFVESLKDLTDPEKPESYLRDGTPFLGKFVPSPNPVAGISEEEIPF